MSTAVSASASCQTSPRRVGVYGGAFDPPHRAHHLLASTAIAQLGLDNLHIVPTGHAWHKARTLTPAAHRLAMCRLAFEDLPGACVDPRETLRAGPSYTIDTVRELQVEYPGACVYVIVGADQAHRLPTWHAWGELKQIAIICVAARAHTLSGAAELSISNTLPEQAVALNMPLCDVSATEVREQVAHHESIASLVFEPVARYIALHHLYQSA